MLLVTETAAVSTEGNERTADVFVFIQYWSSYFMEQRNLWLLSWQVVIAVVILH
jgi:hypothetical protein